MRARWVEMGWATSLLLAAPQIQAQGAAAPSQVFAMPDNAWYEGNLVQLVVAPSGDRALFRLLGKTHLISIATGREDSASLHGDLERLDDAAFCGPGIARRGQRGGEHGWFLTNLAGAGGATLPEDAILTCSTDGTTIAFYRASEPRAGVFVGPADNYKTYRFEGAVIGTAFSPDGASLYVTFINDAGVSSLVHIAIARGHIRTVAADLDMMPYPNTLSVAPDGRHLYLALASAAAPDNALRHQPDAIRFLQIYSVDVVTGARQHVVSSNEDNYDPNVADGSLIWSRVTPHKAIAVVSAAGGEAREVLAGADLPMWSPDGHRISYTYDLDRMADGALPMDGGVISVDASVKASSKPAAFVTGYHEDFTPAWSPDGQWIAFHSHRTPTPVPFYESAGHADDIFLRRAEDRTAPEIRLTDFGWEVGPAYWASDGRRLVFSGWAKGGTPRIDKVWITTIDPKAGQAVRSDRVALPSDLRSANWVTWSPDGKQLAIEDNEGGQARSLWVVAADGSGGRKLLDYTGTTYGGVDWAPDGRTIVYSGLAGDRMQIFAVSPNGGVPRQLTHDAQNLLHPKFSPDGRWIACSRLSRMHFILRQKLGG